MAKKKKETQKVSDGLVNALTALGTERSKRSHFKWTYGSLANYQQYEAAYQESWIARRICDVIPADMIREWREIKCEHADEIRSEEDRLRVPAAFERALSYARLYGGAGIVMITDQDLTKPLDPRRIKKGGLKRLMVLDRWYLTSGDLKVTDVLSEQFMLPAHYYINNAENAIVHESHVVRVIGEPLPVRLALQAHGWGDSALRQALEVLNDFSASVAGVAESMQEFNVDTIRKEGLFDELGSDQEDAILRRFQAWGMMKSLFRVSLLDGEESFDRNSLSYSGIADIIETQMKLVAGAAHTPVTKLFGDSAKGLNATGEGDDVNYHSYIRSEQAAKLDPALRRLDEVLVRSACGTFCEDFNYAWRPLDVPSAQEEATANEIQARADIAYLDAGVVTVSQIQRNLQSAEKYQFDSDRIDELEELENSVDLAERMNENIGDTGAEAGARPDAQSDDEAGLPAEDRDGVSTAAERAAERDQR